MGKKILLLGRAGVGKSTLKEMIFEGSNPDDLLIHSLAPNLNLKLLVVATESLEDGLLNDLAKKILSNLNIY